MIRWIGMQARRTQHEAEHFACLREEIRTRSLPPAGCAEPGIAVRWRRSGRMQAFAHHCVANQTRAILHTPLFIAIPNVLDGDIPQHWP